MKSDTAAPKEESMSANIEHVPGSGTVRANGQELFYEIHGDGPPLVLVMGIGYDSSLWTLQQVPVLSTRFRVVLLDNRDAGRSSRADYPYTIADMADDVAGLLDAVQQTIALLASNPNPVEPEAYDGQARACLHFDAVDRLGDIAAPTLVIVGEQDLLTPPWVAHEVADGIPGARFEMVKGDGSSHVVPLERPDDFNQLVMNFLAG